MCRAIINYIKSILKKESSKGTLCVKEQYIFDDSKKKLCYQWFYGWNHDTHTRYMKLIYIAKIFNIPMEELESKCDEEFVKLYGAWVTKDGRAAHENYPETELGINMAGIEELASRVDFNHSDVLTYLNNTYSSNY